VSRTCCVQPRRPPPPVAGAKVRVQIQSVEQSSGTHCNQVGGTVDFPSGTSTMMIPVDAVQAVTAFPALKGVQKDNCVGSQFSMIVYPEMDRACGGKLTDVKP